ncbi:MAG: hypothetical protein JWR44_3568 [Hymenobacter sp.]|nr:hypothetical protein [Hymenobacter sp.]
MKKYVKRAPRRLAVLPRLVLLLALASGCRSTEVVAPEPVSLGISPLPAPAAQDAVLYEVFIADFSNAGTFDGMLPRLDSLKKLGVNTLWVMPVFPTRGSPYAVDSYDEVNREFGDLAAFDRVVAAAHQRGLRVMLDWVANHTSFYHPWIQQHPNWYNHDANGQIVHPMPQWTDVADLNYDQPALRQAMTAAMKTWVTQHAIDGFRCDAADLVPDDFWKAALTELRQSNPNLFFLAEGSRTSHYASGFQLAFGWDFYNALQSVMIRQAPAATLGTAHAQELQGVPAGAYRLRFTTNHDEVQAGAPATRFGSEAAARAAYVATLAFGATLLVYNGQEAGDPAQLNSPSRRPIRWDFDPSAGNFFRGLLAAYNTLPALRAGPAEYYNQSPGVATVRHRLNGQDVLVLVNLRNSPDTVPLPLALQGAWTNVLTKTAVTSAATVALPAYGYAVWQR